MAQIVYYVPAALSRRAGAQGELRRAHWQLRYVFAAHAARAMGLPIERLVVASTATIS